MRASLPVNRVCAIDGCDRWVRAPARCCLQCRRAAGGAVLLTVVTMLVAFAAMYFFHRV